jgi:uncharacterized protein with PQ loop repeat
MTLAELSLTAFALLNGARIVAYLPQIARVYHDRNGATAVSLMTWVMFAAANVATVAYALIVARDFVVAAVFALNTFGCLVIVVMTALRRLAWARLRQQAPE